MRKLTLEIDNLDVQSFDTGADGDRGTVRGHDTGELETEWCTGYPDCLSEHCPTPADTCNDSCGCTDTCETLFDCG
jgi:hypothetical protein